VLLAGVHKIGDIFKELTGEILRHEVFQLPPGTVQQHAL
jgi:hypothetical protein